VRGARVFESQWHGRKWIGRGRLGERNRELVICRGCISENCP
jgi:hypothetical protein